MADLTNKNFQVPGVNADTNFIKERAFEFDLSAADIAATGTHDLVVIPAGEAIVGLKIVALETVTSGGAATLQFKASFDGTAEALNATAVAVSNLAAGDVHNVAAAAVKGVDLDVDGKLQLTIGTAALTGGRLLVVVETLPVADFVRKG